MKKITIVSVLMSILLSTMFFVTIFFSMGNTQYENTIDANRFLRKINFTETEGFYMFIKLDALKDETVKNEFLEVIKDNHAIATGYSYYEGIDFENIDFYVYNEAKEDIYQSQIYTKDNVRIQFSDEMEERYYTVDKEDKQGILIDFLNPMFYEVSNPYSIHPFHQIKESQIPSFIYVIGMSKEKFLQEIKGSKLSNNVEEMHDIDEASITSVIEVKGIQFNEQNMLWLSMVLAMVTIMLLIIIQIVKRKKYITVARLHGISPLKLIRKQFLGFLLSIFIAYALTQIILLNVVCGSYREVNQDFYHVIIQSIIVFFFVMLLLLICIYVFLWLQSDFHDLKQNKINRFSIKANVIIKIIMTIILMTPFVNLIPDFNEQLQRTIALYDMKEESMNRYSFNVSLNNSRYINGDDTAELTSQIYTLLADEYDAKAYNIFNWKLKKDWNEDTTAFDIPIMSVNRNYLKGQKLYEYGSNKEIDINNLRNGVLLVPKQYEESESEKIYKELYRPSKVIYTENIKNDLKPLILSDITIYNAYYHNPIIYVADEEDVNTIPYISGYIYINTDDLDSVFARLQEAGFSDNITFDPLRASVELEYNRQFVTFSSTLFLLIGYLSVYLIFVYQCVFVYLDVYRRKLSVQYLQGYSYWKRYYEIFVINACAYIVAGVGVYMIYDTSLIAIICYIIFFASVEIIFEIYQIHQFQNKDTIQSLK